MKLARLIAALSLVALVAGSAAIGWAAPADQPPAAKASGPSAKQLLDEARKLCAAHDYEGALKRLQEIKPADLGSFEAADHKSLLQKARQAVPAKTADQKAFDDGRAAYESKNYAAAVTKLSQAAASEYLEAEKVGAAKGLLSKARDEQAAAERIARDKADAQAKAEADKKAKAEADARAASATAFGAAKKAYDARNFDEALKQLKAVNTAHLNFFEKVFSYDPLLSKTQQAVAARAADEKALADGKADLTAKKHAAAIAKLSQAASSDYLPQDQVAAARTALAQARDEKAKADKAAEDTRLAQARAEADKKAQARAASATAFDDAKKAYDARNFDEALKQLKAVNTEHLNFFEKVFSYDPLLARTQKAAAAKAADEKTLADGKADLAAKKYPGAIAKLSQAASSDYLAQNQVAAAKAALGQAKAEKAAADAPKPVAVAVAPAPKPPEKPAPAPVAKPVTPAPAPVVKPVAQPIKPVEPAPVAVAPKPPQPAPPQPVAPAPPPPPAPAPATLAAQARRAEAEEEIKMGADALATHEYQKALIHYKKALELWPESEAAQKGSREAQRLTGEREEPISDILRDVRNMERGRIIAEVQDLQAQAERAMAKAVEVGRPEDYNDALRPLAQADRTIDVATVLLPEEQERLREDVHVLRKEILTRKATAESARERKAAQEAATRETQRRAADRADRENKVRQLWERATELRKSMQFMEAVQVLDRLLAVDPNDERAMRWREDLQYLEAQARQVGVRDARKAGTVEVLVDTEKAATPVGEELNGAVTYLRYPVARDWEDLTKFRRDFTKAVSAEPKAVSETRRRLSEPIDLDFEKTSLDNVLKYISEVHRGLNIVIDPDIAAGGVDLTTRVVDLKVKRVSIESVLGLILGADLGYRVEAGYLLITTKDKLQQNLPVVTYPVQDLVASIPDFSDQAPRFEVSTVLQAAAAASGGGGAAGLFGGGVGAAPADQPVGSQELIAIIQRTVSNQSDPSVAAWSDEGGPAAIEYMNGLLIITQTRRGHEKVSDLLEQLRRERAIMISVESRFCQVSDQFLQDITLDVDAAFVGVSDEFRNVDTTGAAVSILDPNAAAGTPGAFRTLPGVPPTAAAAPISAFANPAGQPIIVSSTGSNNQGTATLLPLGGSAFANFGLNEGGMAVSGVFLDEVQVGFLLRAIQADVRSTVLQSPRITLYNGQRSYISVSTVTTYIADAEPVVAEAAVGWDLQISAIPVGVTLDVKATVSADRRYVQMDLRPQSAQLDTSINPTGFQTYPISAAVPGGIATFTIELPRVIVQDFKTTVSVPDGGTLLLGGTRRYTEAEVETGVPVLSKVPILKRLFNNRASLRNANNLLILIKPKIIIQAEEEHRLGYDNF